MRGYIIRLHESIQSQAAKTHQCSDHVIGFEQAALLIESSLETGKPVVFQLVDGSPIYIRFTDWAGFSLSRFHA